MNEIHHAGLPGCVPVSYGKRFLVGGATRWLFSIIGFLCLASLASAYTSQYPPAQSDTYVKASSFYSGSFRPYFATDPVKSLTGASANAAWLASSAINQRFHIDLGAPKTITRVYYENFHDTGGLGSYGVRNFTLWGSNADADFADLTYAVNGSWVQLATSQSTFDQHVSANIAAPSYIEVIDSTAYRYYRFKFQDNYGAIAMGVRRIELQITDVPAPFVDLTNDDAAVSYDITEYAIGGTNNEHVVGTMTWSNAANAANGTLAAITPWLVVGVPLSVGGNVITVTGTNSLGVVASDSVTMTRFSGMAQQSGTGFKFQ